MKKAFTLLLLSVILTLSVAPLSNSPDEMVSTRDKGEITP